MVLPVQEVQSSLDVAASSTSQEVRELQDPSVEQRGQTDDRRSGFNVCRKRLRHVYLIQMGTWQREYPVWKIGVADDARTRFDQIRQAYRVDPRFPLVPRFVYYAECWEQDAFKIESYLHELLAEYRMEGEWFHLPRTLIEQNFMIERWDVPWPAVSICCNHCWAQIPDNLLGLA